MTLKQEFSTGSLLPRAHMEILIFLCRPLYFDSNYSTFFFQVAQTSLTLIGLTSERPSRFGGGAPEAPPVYLSCLWTDFQNSFVWWKLLKIVIDFYSISNFLSFIVWPLEVAEVTKVSRVNFFNQENPKFSIFSYKHVIYLKWKLKLCRIQIHSKKLWYTVAKIFENAKLYHWNAIILHFICTELQICWGFLNWRICNFFVNVLKNRFSIAIFLH